MTICKNCKHYRHLMQNPAAPEVWYNHFCGASPLPRERSLITGELVAIVVNDLGQKYESDRAYAFCRDINTGNCKKFEDK